MIFICLYPISCDNWLTTLTISFICLYSSDNWWHQFHLMVILWCRIACSFRALTFAQTGSNWLILNFKSQSTCCKTTTWNELWWWIKSSCTVAFIILEHVDILHLLWKSINPTLGSLASYKPLSIRNLQLNGHLTHQHYSNCTAVDPSKPLFSIQKPRQMLQRIELLEKVIIWLQRQPPTWGHREHERKECIIYVEGTLSKILGAQTLPSKLWRGKLQTNSPPMKASISSPFWCQIGFDKPVKWDTPWWVYSAIQCHFTLSFPMEGVRWWNWQCAYLVLTWTSWLPLPLACVEWFWDGSTQLCLGWDSWQQCKARGWKIYAPERSIDDIYSKVQLFISSFHTCLKVISGRPVASFILSLSHFSNFFPLLHPRVDIKLGIRLAYPQHRSEISFSVYLKFKPEIAAHKPFNMRRASWPRKSWTCCELYPTQKSAATKAPVPLPAMRRMCFMIPASSSTCMRNKCKLQVSYMIHHVLRAVSEDDLSLVFHPYPQHYPMLTPEFTKGPASPDCHYYTSNQFYHYGQEMNSLLLNWILLIKV